MKNKVLSLLSAAVLVLALGSMAKADGFGASTNCTGGEIGLSQGSDAEACITVTSTSITLDSFYLNGVLTTVGKVFVIGWNNGATFDHSNDTVDSWSVAACGGNTCTDGWSADFSDIHGASSTPTNGDNLGQIPSLEWFFTGTSVAGTSYILHIGGFANNTCSVWVSSTATVANPGPNTATGSDCTGTSVPEPGSLALFGTGILGMAGYLRRRLLS